MQKLAAFTLLALSALHPLAFADPVPSNRRIDWTYTGVPNGIPNRSNICATFSPGAKASAINSAISSCNNGVILLNAGTYSSASLGGTIQVYQSNVTLRGAGANQTILTGLDIINLGTGYNVSLGTTITGGAKGATQIVAASAANLSPGTMIEIDRDDDPTLVVNTGNQAGGKRNVSQVNMITAVSGNTITLRNPLIYDFSTGTPKIKWYFAGITKNSGVESLKLDHTGFSGGYNFVTQYCDSCWLKGVESAHASGYHFVFLGTLNMEVRDSYIHEGATGPNNSGVNFYGNYLYGANSSAKIENNIFNKNSPAVEINGSSSGLYIGYNFEYGAYDGTIVTWTFDDGHAPFNIMNLYEGNIGEMMGADNYFGGTGYGTALRNYFRGYNLYGAVSEAVWLDRLAYNYNLVGNVLGSMNQSPTAYLGCAKPAIYRLGYPNLGNCSSTPWDGFVPTTGAIDSKVTTTLLRWGNYDYFNKATRFVASEVPSGVSVPTDQVIPPSYYYSAKPAWWTSSIAWPPIGPDVTGGNGDAAGHVNKIPAQVCWEASNLLAGGSFNASTCYSTTTPPPPPLSKPVITSALTASLTVGTPFSYAITATNSPTSFSATALPPGLSVSSSTGVISGTPTSAGVTGVTVSATNATGTGSATLVLTVTSSTSSSSLFSTSSVPATVTVADGNSVELGVKFSASKAGAITGVRFYKGPQNVGVHTAHLWNSAHALIASATFTNETASGWQSVNFASPVSISANTTYVASYHSSGFYSATGGFFSQSLVKSPLTAPASASSGGNGVYAYGSSVAYPSKTYNATNYSVDVMFR